MKRLGMRELIAALALLAILALVFLPALQRAREPARRSSCQNNLKQWGLVAKMFANEHEGLLPPVSPVPNNWIMDMAGVYPEYLNDLQILLCPTSPGRLEDTFCLRDVLQHPDAHVGDPHPDCATSLCYIYTGYKLRSDAEAIALVAALEDGAPGDADLLLDVPRMGGLAPEEKVDLRDPASLAKLQSMVPIMWDRVSADDKQANHTPNGANVLYLDGHVDFMHYAHDNASTMFPVTAISAELFSVLPELPDDCS